MAAAIKVALAGNPNCGKTALFNALTGMEQRVGNWPGVTVEKKEGTFYHADHAVSVVDLPGVYTLISHSDDGGLDQKIAVQHLVGSDVDVVVNVVDATNVERHLYLTTQLLELGLPVVVAVNMLDLLEKRKATLDLDALAQQLGCPVVGIVANKKHNIDSLQQAIVTATLPAPSLVWPDAIVQARQCLAVAVQAQEKMPQRRAEFIALQLLQGDSLLQARMGNRIDEEVRVQITAVESTLNEDVEIYMADKRYTLCHQAKQASLSVSSRQSRTATDRLDALVLHRWFGIPIFLLVMYAMFFFAVNIGGAFQDFFDLGSTAVFITGVTQLLNAVHAPAWLTAILANGLGKGINTTITFIPMIAGLFLFLSFLEDSGYMARAAFVMDRLMRTLGLPGESFVPMIVGFGCNVPAVMGARTLSNPRDRILTVLMMPFMACGARFAIFTVFVSAFFRHSGSLVIFGLYLLGILAAVLTGFLFRRQCLSGQVAPLVLELPSYHKPQLSAIFRLAVRRVGVFVKRASRVIIPVCVVLGSLNAITLSGHLSGGEAGRNTVLSAVGRTITPALAPMGIHQDNWPATVGLVTGVLAKEVVVGTLNTLYSQQANLHVHNESVSVMAGLRAAVQSIPVNLSSLASALSNPIKASAADVFMGQRVYGVMVTHFSSTAAALSYLVFVLLYFPCVSTLAIMRREIGRRWAAVSMAWSCILAYGFAVICFQAMTLSSHWLTGFIWIGSMLLILWAVVRAIEWLSFKKWLTVVA